MLCTAFGATIDQLINSGFTGNRLTLLFLLPTNNPDAKVVLANQIMQLLVLRNNLAPQLNSVAKSICEAYRMIATFI